MSFWKECREGLNKVYDALQDNESREIFDARVEYMFDHNQENYINKIYERNEYYPKKWRIGELDNQIDQNQKIIIYGCGHDGKLIKRNLEICKYNVIKWCDSNKEMEGKYVDGIEVISIEKVVTDYRDALIVIGSEFYSHEIRLNIFEAGFPFKNVYQFLYNRSIGCASNGKQYFDLFKPNKKEIFVDAGAYNGDTIYDFLSWCEGNEYKVYSIEPLSDMCDFIRKRMICDEIQNINVENFAAWNKKEMLNFNNDTRGSGVSKDGKTQIIGNSIDDIVQNDKVTFIKMDIEGAELKALEGARDTIIKNNPRLAICIYHKYTDIYDIGSYILSLNPNYKFYIRHYSTCMWETVLYATL